MDQRWDFARQQWQTSFAPLVEAGYRIERLADTKAYFELHEKELRQFFPPEVFFRVEDLRSPERKERQARLRRVRDDHRLEDFIAVYKDETLAAMFCGHQHIYDSYRMWHANVAPAFRGKGLYRQVLKSTIDYTDKLGFATIVSEHAPANNPVLIAKLSAGFRITDFQVEASVGVSIHLTYFHIEDELDLLQFRTGLATLNPRSLGTAFGAIQQLKAQLNAE